MLVSIITATYNSELTIRDTIESIDKQTYKDIEHIIVDGLSSDSTLEIVKQFPRIRKVCSEKDDGLYFAMNKGISIASGEVIGILNSDDLYAHNRVIEKVVDLFRDPQVQAVYADLEYVEAGNLETVIRYWRSGGFSSQKFYYGWMPPHPTFFVRKELYDIYGVFNTSFRSAADYEIMLRFLVRYDIPATYLPEVIVKMRAGGISNAGLANRYRANREDRRAWRVNGLTPYFFTFFLKPVRKLPQYLIKQ
ncbi:glycosyltransferase family 2 protein [Flavihumibacter profundi]|uniref:glycosyltransferase family 2 protein n=1 Tax=Flavihumibacter profundi TaxID=2716883 RepID=UPI001CC76BD1|nr:glycosyltransferase family 2 protein [Flavihumibacter profundi]MBZ5858010.1 glycosyltransferase [Flavihumibacter profundi]